MKTSFVALLTMAVGAFASPIAVQRDTEVQVPITFVTLTESVRTYTAQINKTLETVPENPTVQAQINVVTTLTPQIEGITDLLLKATKAATSKEFLTGVTGDTLSAVLGLVNEVVYTVKALIQKLGLDHVIQLIQPLILALGGLVRALNLVVDGLLIIVQGILNTVLNTVANLLTTLI
ncbi:hypothetical protein KVR01_000335 [Diaporthe batatas]|uniref:uncharacterized protein n=1 Tax=Diaporthe batatas TaxID=748121 RepID=UPI001D039F30|nr:uncharacterized protein KVR01_000335 [Diaporthe batatas]KAG8169590.1 hypothetical protein KVR01_000335 [Diaporthe batatas]